MKVLDLYCGGGGASMGIHQAGFEVTGVDIMAQPEYPFQFFKGDAVEFLETILEDLCHNQIHLFDAYFASPPCQHYSVANTQWRNLGYEYPDLVSATRELLTRIGKPFVLENVPRAPLRKDLVLCGSMFDDGTQKYVVRRHRVFEIHGFEVPQIKHEKHKGKVGDGRVISVFGHGGGVRYNHATCNLDAWREAMGMPWVTKRRTLTEAIPPCYTKYIFEHLYRELNG